MRKYEVKQQIESLEQELSRVRHRECEIEAELETLYGALEMREDQMVLI